MKKLGLAFGLMALMASCNNDDTNTPTSAPIPSEYNNLMPLSLGKRWNYYSNTQYSEGSNISYSRIYSNWVVSKDTVIEGNLSFVISKTDSSANLGAFLNRNDYYFSDTSGFYLIASNYGSLISNIWLKQRSVITDGLFLNDHNFKNLSKMQNVVTFTPPRFLLKYPAIIDGQWESIENGNLQGKKRKYVGIETITVPAGTFDCIHLQVDLSGSQNSAIILNQYFSPGIGLIKVSYSWPHSSTVTETSTTELISTNF